MQVYALVTAVWMAGVGATQTGANELRPLLDALRAVGPEGAGHMEAAEPWQRLAQLGPEALPEILIALDGANPLAANWLRTAVDAIAQRALARGQRLPAAELEKFACEVGHAPRARRLAYELLIRVDATAPERLLPRMLQDPSLELRRDAVARLASQVPDPVPPQRKDEAVAVLLEALGAARDLDQVRSLAERLRKLGHTVDLARHFGLVQRWWVIGPFDNGGGKGLDAVYPPEQQVDLAAAYPGKHGEVRWRPYLTTHEYGQVDLNQALGEEKAVVAYAAADFLTPEARDVQIRISSANALKLWVNGKLVATSPAYHSGREWDQFIVPVRFEAGRNQLLLKVCQNEQTQDWARIWAFQLRVCDAMGGAVLSADRDQPNP